MNKTTFSRIYTDRFVDDAGDDLPQVEEIVIPIIQRDYAQGRKSQERIRNEFLDALHSTLSSYNPDAECPMNPVTLDFIYGDITENGEFIPLDGQQRLTTLFLLSWYAARKEGVPSDRCKHLKHFRYKTRPSAEAFCESVVEYCPENWAEKISDQIRDEAWFPSSWNHDATISSMLVMLDAIQTKFKDVKGIWNALECGAVSFYFLPISKMGLTDDIYIRMNSRGKPLTEFEHFKALLLGGLRAMVGEDVSKRIGDKIDQKWTDLLWPYARRTNDSIVDRPFLRYFKFICRILCHRRYAREGSLQGSSFETMNEWDALKLLREFFLDASEIQNNVQMLERSLDCWRGENPRQWCARFISESHVSGKILADTPDRFGKCVLDDKLSLGDLTLLYTLVSYRMEREALGSSDAQFAVRLRTIWNLIRNSVSELADSARGNNRLRMGPVFEQVDAILRTGVPLEGRAPSFNAAQLLEERDKHDWLADNVDQAEALWRLEDHPLLLGRVDVVGIEHPEHFVRFAEFFPASCDSSRLALVGKALLAKGDYLQGLGSRYLMGCHREQSWKELFHSGREKIKKTATVLSALLSSDCPATDTALQLVVDDYLDRCKTESRYDWRYYFLKYQNVFMPYRYGSYKWYGGDYEVFVLWSESFYSSSAWQPFLRALQPSVEDWNHDRSNPGIRISGMDIFPKNVGYVIRRENTPDEEISIPQVDGIDTVDRIEYMKQKIVDYVSCETCETRDS